jgi:serine acetyltransferase
LVYLLNSAIFSNSLPFQAVVSDDVQLGHHAFGTVIHPNVVIGPRVKIFHNVTMVVRSAHNPPKSIVLEDDVRIGANSVLITSRNQGIRVGRGARIGAGAVVTRDVPAGATVVSARPRVLMPDRNRETTDALDDEPAG